MFAFFQDLRSFYFAIIVGVIRMTAIFSMLPFFGKKNVMGMGRNSWVLGLTLFTYPIFSQTCGNVDISLGATLLLATKEIIVGSVLGFLGSFIFFVVEGVGNLIDVQRGASSASLFSAFNESQTTVFADFFVQLVLLLFFLSGGFLFFLDIIYQSYVYWPIFSFIPRLNGELAYYFVNFMGEYASIVFALVGPILFTLFLAEFGLGMVNRFAPQMNVFFLSMGIKSGLSALFLILYFYHLLNFFLRFFFEKSKVLEFFANFWN
ncbi:MAG: type III secretion system export apparatus subunit SctT [Puniceicoccales bacterium]|jgi:type III secretion protein T|nr:type III secretion system export apparatus subunit SctT [Puniceicoccales bacterium]